MIANAAGERDTPSIVGFTDTEEVVGLAALAQEHRNAKRTFTAVTAAIGLGGAPAEAAAAARRLLNHEVSGAGEFEMEQKGDAPPVKVSAEQMVGRLVADLKATAEAFLGAKPTACVVTVPAGFSESQKAAVVRVCAAQKLRVVQFLPAPLAGVIGMDLTRASDAATGAPVKDRTVMVVDVGLRMEVSVVKIVGGLPRLTATKAFPEIGGGLIDEVLVEHFAGEFKKKTGLNVRDSKRAVVHLRHACKQTKVNLTSSQQGAVVIDSLLDGVDFQSSINRGRFEGLIGPICTKIVDALDSCLTEFKLELDDITDFILLGGTCRIPKVAADLAAFFELEPLHAAGHITSDEAAVSGAAAQGYFLSTHLSAEELAARTKAVTEAEAAALVKADPRLSGATTSGPIASASLGVAAADGSFHAVLPRGSLLPAVREVSLPIKAAAGEPVTLDFAVGESAKASENTPIAKVVATAGPAANRVARITVTAAKDGSVTLKVVTAGGEPQSVSIPVA